MPNTFPLRQRLLDFADAHNNWLPGLLYWSARQTWVREATLREELSAALTKISHTPDNASLGGRTSQEREFLATFSEEVNETLTSKNNFYVGEPTGAIDLETGYRERWLYEGHERVGTVISEHGLRNPITKEEAREFPGFRLL
jgi:hypothetical protein